MNHELINAKKQEALTKLFESESFKSFVDGIKSASEEDTGRFEVIITTEDVDRMGEVIKADGWDFTHYMKNPIVLWGHDYSALPIGITDSIELVDGNKYLAKGRFAPESANPLAQQVRRLYDLGIQRATSVGFIDLERTGNVITKAQLLEYSFVSVPANPMALSTLIKSNINVNELVTKGLLSVKDAEQSENKEEQDDKTPAEPKNEGEEEQKQIDVSAEFKKLSEQIIALEKLLKEVLEGNNADSAKNPKETEDEIVPDSEDQKAYQEFCEKRKILQAAATVLGDVLAGTRQALIKK